MKPTRLTRKKRLESGAECYEMYRNEHMATWDTVSRALGVSTTTARLRAIAFARKFRKEWPPLEPGDARRRDSRWYKGELVGADLKGRYVAPGVIIANWDETLSAWDTL